MPPEDLQREEPRRLWESHPGPHLCKVRFDEHCRSRHHTRRLRERTAKPIDLFQGQIQEWILGLAQSLAHQHERKEHAGIAVLLLAASVLEPLGGVLPIAKGRRSSEAKSCNGFVRVFGDVSGIKDTWQAAERVCELLRHGLFHEGFVKAGVVLTHQDMPIQEKDGIIFIDAVRFVDAVAVAFDEVCNEIRSAKAGDQSLQAFDAYWTGKRDGTNKKTGRFG